MGGGRFPVSFPGTPPYNLYSMKKPRLALQSARIENFKAVRDSGEIRFTPLTVFIGNNGSGKSSILEGLELLRDIAFRGLGPAMERWRGFEDIWNKAVPHDPRPSGQEPEYLSNPMRFRLNGSYSHLRYPKPEVHRFRALSEVTQEPSGKLRFLKESYADSGSTHVYRRMLDGIDSSQGGPETGRSLLTPVPVALWQFLRLDANIMTQPVTTPLVAGSVKLQSDGSNLALYLWEIYEDYPEVFTGILEALRYVLPYASELRRRKAPGSGGKSP
jgi:predicted ATPase